MANEFALKGVISKFEKELSPGSGPNGSSSYTGEQFVIPGNVDMDPVHMHVELQRARKELAEVQEKLKDFVKDRPHFAQNSNGQNPFSILMSDMARLFESVEHRENVSEVNLDGTKMAYINETEADALERKNKLAQVKTGNRPTPPPSKEEHDRIMVRLSELEELEKRQQQEEAEDE